MQAPGARPRAPCGARGRNGTSPFRCCRSPRARGGARRAFGRPDSLIVDGWTNERTKEVESGRGTERTTDRAGDRSAAPDRARAYVRARRDRARHVGAHGGHAREERLPQARRALGRGRRDAGGAAGADSVKVNLTKGEKE